MLGTYLIDLNSFVSVEFLLQYFPEKVLIAIIWIFNILRPKFYAFFLPINFVIPLRILFPFCWTCHQFKLNLTILLQHSC